MTATLQVRPLPDGRVISINCRHGQTHALYANGPADLGCPQLTDADVARVVLARHAQEQPACRCVRKLWRQHFAADWPTVRIA